MTWRTDLNFAEFTVLTCKKITKDKKLRDLRVLFQKKLCVTNKKQLSVFRTFLSTLLSIIGLVARNLIVYKQKCVSFLTLIG